MNFPSSQWQLAWKLYGVSRIMSLLLPPSPPMSSKLIHHERRFDHGLFPLANNKLISHHPLPSPHDPDFLNPACCSNPSTTCPRPLCLLFPLLGMLFTKYRKAYFFNFLSGLCSHGTLTETPSLIVHCCCFLKYQVPPSLITLISNFFNFAYFKAFNNKLKNFYLTHFYSVINWATWSQFSQLLHINKRNVAIKGRRWLGWIKYKIQLC